MNNSYHKRTICRTVICLLLVLLLFPAAWGEEIRVTNTAEYVGAGRYDWTVHLEADSATLDQISYVEYTLHPSFPNPVRRSEDRASNFAISSNGWGEFNIQTRVVFQNEDTSALASHWLTLRRPLEIRRPVVAVNRDKQEITAGNTAEPAGRGRWNWAVFILAEERVLADVRCVEYTLHPSFPDPVRTICEQGPDPARPFMLEANGWGTFTIRIKVTFNDDYIRHLKHELSFGRVMFEER